MKTPLLALFAAILAASCSVKKDGGDLASTITAISAGDDQMLILPGTLTLTGTYTADGEIPDPLVTWSTDSGPTGAAVTYTDSGLLQTGASFSGPGTYIIRIAISYRGTYLTDTMTVAVFQDQAPVVNAGADQGITSGSSATLDGTITDDGLPGTQAPTAVWSKESGPGTVTFVNANTSDTSATFSADGTYILKLTSNDGLMTADDTVTIIVSNGPPNNAPSIDAGSDGTVTLPASANLDGTASDDGVPAMPGALTYAWTKVSGPGTVTFGNATAIDTTATFSQAGNYVLRLTADDGQLTNSDTVAIIVNPTLAEQRFIAARAFWTARCSGCHDWHARSEAQFISGGFVVPGDYQNSKIYYRMRGSDGALGPKTMAPGYTPSAAELSTIKDWANGL